ncbi:universal stress protein [Halobaculum lipolyticum]|uniref:Universal stress protein n=1 Tax=Halobaculum lipolyticum TaxID=3032001 RepID=A0ABD5W3Y3_9EURY|nr:universal stress protein [Halobaculum sp. DT31]
MSKRILVGVDDSEQSAAALSFVAEEWGDADVTLVSVIDPAESKASRGAGVPSGAEEWYERTKRRAEERLAEAADSLAVDGTVETATVVGKPASALVEYATDHDLDHIVVGSHGRRGISRIVLGSVAEAVVRTSPVPVTVVR